MRTQQEAEKAEQKRIKNLVLRYDQQSDSGNDAESANGDSQDFLLRPNLNRLCSIDSRQSRRPSSRAPLRKKMALSEFLCAEESKFAETARASGSRHGI